MADSGATVASGLLRDRHPYVRFGSGSRALVVLPGMALDNDVPGRLTTWAYARGFHALAAEHTVHIIGRGQGLKPGTSTSDLANDYAAVLGDGDGDGLGPAVIMGLSTGGLIAQHLALDHPHLVDRLVLVVTGARLAPPGQEICRHWQALAAARRWRSLRGDLAAAAIDGAAAQRLARLAGALAGGRAPSAVHEADFAATVGAVLAHDTLDRLGSLTTPTLLIGGAQDPFFPAAGLRETAAAIPGATLHVHDHTGHGLPKSRARGMLAETLEFLRR
ncbi:alpha/beta fold hydrolase [Nonomuraea sp. NPDC050643]|uniref:alpha/beta fold hydrolase n=1 Tax=Nonomuraea sp. NPDC050643 TaxID=3155660 RepID=UPI0033C6A282